MTKKLFLDAIIKITAGVLLMGLLIFLPAWSLDYWQGWLLMGLLFIPMFCAGVVMMLKNPEMATHPWTEELGGLQPMGSHRVRHN